MNTIFLPNERIAELAKQAQENIAIKANDDYDTRWWKPELYDQEFARLIIEEVIMSNYETRLYALAVRAPISEAHTSKVENELVLKIRDRLEQEFSAIVCIWRMIEGKKYSKDCLAQLPRKIGGITIDRAFSSYVPLPYIRLDALAGKAQSGGAENANMLTKAYAALDYAKIVINTPQEQVMSSLPVDEEVCKAILEMSILEKNISEYLNTPFDKDSVLASVKEFLESIEQYEYKETLHKEPYKHSEHSKMEYSKIAYPPMLEDEKTTLATSINWWICGGVLVNIILLICFVC